MKNSAQRRCKHCALAVVRQSQNFLPHHKPPSQGHGTVWYGIVEFNVPLDTV